MLDTVKGQGVRHFEEMADNHSVKFGPEDVAVIDRAVAELELVCGRGE